MQEKILSATSVVIAGMIGMFSSVIWGALADLGSVSYWLSWVAWAIAGAFVLGYIRAAYQEFQDWKARQ